MNCEYFGKCGSCTLYDKNYEEQLEYKVEREQKRFKNFISMPFDIIKSAPQSFRNRAEFRIWKTYDENNHAKLSYAMTSFEKTSLPINSCQIISTPIAKLMPNLLKALEEKELFSFKLYSCEFLSATTGDTLVTLIYHKKLEQNWIEEAKQLETQFNIKIIGRSRKQKEVLSQDYIQESLQINEQPFSFEYFEGGFTQPNTKVNVQMIEWVINNLPQNSTNTDLCELYCGGGNFTIPLSKRFNKVLATEISKTSIKSAKINCDLNDISNIDFIRMSSEEFVEALKAKREFRRLKDIKLSAYNFSTIFVDPPRAGLDETTTKLAQTFDNILYISCNPETLHRDLKTLVSTHQILRFALFDQFAYTNHIECGVILRKM